MLLSLSFIVITLLCLLFFYRAIGKNKRVLTIPVLWIIVVSVLSIIGFFKNTDTIPPRFLVVFLGNIIFVIYLYRKLETHDIDYNKVMLIHTLRIPVELILYSLFLQKKVPEIMTFQGYNFDILIGISAFIFYILHQFFKLKLTEKILLIWNIIGLLFLINIVLIAILSAPLPMQQLAFDQPNIAVLQFPFVLLASFIVPVVFISHLIAIKHLMRR